MRDRQWTASFFPRTWVDAVSHFATKIDLYNFGRWLVLAVLIGVVAGLAAALLTWGIQGVEGVLQGQIVGFHAPGHGAAVTEIPPPAKRPWMLLLILPGVGLLVGWIVQTFAPEAEGHGTDAVIESYHRKRALMRRRIGPIKLLASMLTIGSGGSAGREGPVAQVGAGFASHLARVLNFPVHERRILVIAGMAAGIGGMFRAPLGAALFAIEVFYSEAEYESEALIPAIMSSIVAYVVVGSLTGFGVMFRTPVVPVFSRPQELLSYLVLGMLLAFVGIVYVKVFYGLNRGFFAKLPLPKMARPAVGGLGVAIIAQFLPQVMGGGYGWLQLTLDEQLPLKLMLLILPAKILATSFTISSGGSGGVFAPSLVIGGMTGAIFADLMHRVAPAMAPVSSACVLVGMGGFFAGVAKVPIASLIMVAEMSGSYNLLIPMMLVSSVAFLLTRGTSIYEAQVPGRIDSPAHIGEFQIDILEQLKVSDVLEEDKEMITFKPGTAFEELLDIISNSEQELFPVVGEDGNIESVFSVNDVRLVVTTPEVWSLLVASDLGVGAHAMAFLQPDDDLHSAVRAFTAFKREALPVLAHEPPAPVIGFLTHHRVMEAYDNEIHRLRDDD